MSTPQNEGVLHVSKCLKHQVLLDPEEMRALFAELQNFYIFAVSEPVQAEEMQISQEEFLLLYQRYIAGIQMGNPLEDRLFRRAFSSIWTVDSSFLYAISLPSEKYLVKSLRPVLQLQPHRFIVSSVDEKIHPLVLGAESISWGIQFSYPQLCQIPKSNEIVQVSREFPNSQLYWFLSRWLRKHTLPTPFLFQGKRLFSSLRLGKRCVSWIHKHLDLNERKIQCALS